MLEAILYNLLDLYLYESSCLSIGLFYSNGSSASQIESLAYQFEQWIGMQNMHSNAICSFKCMSLVILIVYCQIDFAII